MDNERDAMERAAGIAEIAVDPRVCKVCPKASFCDVPKNPQDYLHDDDCQCFKCRESAAEAVRP